MKNQKFYFILFSIVVIFFIFPLIFALSLIYESYIFFITIGALIIIGYGILYYQFKKMGNRDLEYQCMEILIILIVYYLVYIFGLWVYFNVEFVPSAEVTGL